MVAHIGEIGRSVTGGRHTNERGYTLVELMVGMLLLGMLAISFFTLFTTLVRSALIIKRKAVANTLATTQMEYLKSLPYDSLAIAGGPFTIPTYIPATKTTVVNGVTYTTTTAIDSVDDAFDGCITYPNVTLQQAQCRNFVVHAGAPTSDTNAQDYKIIHVRVSDSNNYILAEVDSQVSARVAETASTTGALFVTVLDETGSPLVGATVTLTNSTLAPAVSRSDVSDSTGIAAFYGLVPDNGYDYVVQAEMTGYSTLKTIAPASPLTPTYSSQTVITQASSSVTMTLKPMTSDSILVEATDTSGVPINGMKIYAKGGYKRYTATTDTTYYYDNMTASSLIPPTTTADSRPTTSGGGLAGITDLVPGTYIFCGNTGNTSCAVGGTTYYLAAAVPYGGSNSFNPIDVPVYYSSPAPVTYPDGGRNYMQKVRLIFSTSSSFPRITTITPDDASTASGTLGAFAFVITGVNLPCNSNPASCATTVRLLQGSNTYTASCRGNNSPATGLNCTVNIATAAMGATRLQIQNSGGTLTVPTGFSLGGINVTP